MIVTIIMILTDWLMVGVTKMVYSCKVAYRQGMLFGVHVPGDAAELPEVKTMIEKYQSWMKAFYRWHFAIGTVICFLGMWYMSIFFIAWTVWMTAFFIGVMGKVWQTHRHMYELKMQKGWYEAISEEEGDKCRGYKDSRQNSPNGSADDLSCTAVDCALWAVGDTGALACHGCQFRELDYLRVLFACLWLSAGSSFVLRQNGQ